MKHTPGPWYESNTGNHQGLIIAEDTGENIAVSYDKINARLISAAPEMLEALKKIELIAIDLLKYSEVDQEIARDLNAIIDPIIFKAQG